MRRLIAHRAALKPFSVLREIGLSANHMQRLERYRTKHERLHRVVGVLQWPDGTWCALAIHSEKFSAVIFDDGQNLAAYEDARSMIDGDFLPLLSLRWEVHA
jgi:hypothetical protein